MERSIQRTLSQHLLALFRKLSLRNSARAVLIAGIVFITGCADGSSSGAQPQDDLVKDPNSNQPIVTPTPDPSPTPKPKPTPTPIPLSVKTLTVNPEVVSKSVTSNGLHLTPQIVFNNSGAGVATWSVVTGNGGRTLYAVFDAETKSWSPEKTLANSSMNVPEPQLISNGQTFLLAWQKDYELYAQVLTPGAAPSWSDVRRLDTGAARLVLGQFGLATDGNSYLLAWNSPGVYAQMYINGGWLAQPELIGPEDPAGGYRLITDSRRKLISGGASGYAAAWTEIGDGITVSRDVNRIRATVFSNSTHAWSGAATVASEVSYISEFAMASNDIGHALNWTMRPPDPSASRNAPTRVSSFDSRVTPTTWSAPTTLSMTTASRSFDALIHSRLAASHSEFMAVWVEQDTSTLPYKLMSSHYSRDATNPPAWNPSAAISAATYSTYVTSADINPELVGNDAGFACLWQNDTGLVRAVYTVSSWSVEPPIKPATGLFITAARLEAFANQFALSYAVKPTSVSATTPEQSYASEWSASQWSPALAVLPARNNGLSGSFLGDETATIAGSSWGFWYAAPLRAYNAADHISNVVIRRPGALPDVEEKLAVNAYAGSALSPLLAANSSGDLLATWRQFDDGRNVLYAAIRHAGVWSAPAQLDAPYPGVVDSGVYASSIHVASNGNTFAVAWRDASGVNLRRFNGVQWDSAPRRVQGNATHVSTAGAALATYKTGYALSWVQRTESAFGTVRSVELATLLDNKWVQIQVESGVVTNVYGPNVTDLAESKDNALLVAYDSIGTDGSITLTTRAQVNDAWADPTAISAINSSGINGLTLQSTPSGSFALYWQLNYHSQLFAALLLPNASAWTTPKLLATDVSEFGSVAGIGGHSAAWFASTELNAVQSNSVDWQLLASRQPNWQVGYYYEAQPRMVEVGATILYAWNATDYWTHAVGLGKLIDGVWTEAFAVGDFGVGPIQRRDPSLARFGDGAAMAWVQYNRDIDASVAEIVVQPALF
jgi:hypothetical protein